MREKPVRASWRTITSRIGYSPIGISGFGSTTVYGLRRVPFPPARMTARLDIVDARLVALHVVWLAEPGYGFLQTFAKCNLRGPPGEFLDLGVVAEQALDFTLLRPHPCRFRLDFEPCTDDFADELRQLGDR